MDRLPHREPARHYRERRYQSDVVQQPYFENTAKGSDFDFRVNVPETQEPHISSLSIHARLQSEAIPQRRYSRQENALLSSIVTGSGSESSTPTALHKSAGTIESTVLQSTSHTQELSATGYLGQINGQQESMVNYDQSRRRNVKIAEALPTMASSSSSSSRPSRPKVPKIHCPLCSYTVNDESIILLHLEAVHGYDNPAPPPVPPRNDHENHSPATQPKTFSYEAQALEPTTMTKSPPPIPSESSEDSFIQVERLKFYSTKVKEAIRTENWKEAEEFQSCIFEILLHQDVCISADWYMDGATISYMLGNLEEAKNRLDSIPKTLIIDPITMLKSYSLESAILIREKDYDSAYTACKKAAKMARKSNLPEYMYLAYYLLQRLFVARGDMKEADFYRQLIQPGFELPNYAKVLDEGAQASQPVQVPVPSIRPESLNMVSSINTIPVELPAPVPAPRRRQPGVGQTYNTLSSVKNQSTRIHRIIVGVDFGMSYSAVAWASSSDPDSIKTLNEWPGTSARLRDSVPTEISYHEGSLINFNWGYDIPPGARRLFWFKLLLESNDPDVSRRVNLPQGLDGSDVVTDFLKALYNHTMDTLHRKHGQQSIVETFQIDFVITVPPVWNEAAKQRIRKCAENAGFANGHNLMLMSELEVAAAICIKSLDITELKAMKHIVVCSVGASTADCISYTCLETIPTLRLRECSVGEGAFCGSGKVDRNFETFIKVKMGHHFDKLSPNTRQRVLKNFEDVRCGYRDRPDQDIYYVTVPTINNLPESGIENGEFMITRKEMQSLFDPVVTEVITLLYNQIKEIAENFGTKCQAICLIGSFGETQYLFQRIVEWAGPYGINVIQSQYGNTTIAQGAVYQGWKLALESRNLSKTQHDIKSSTATESIGLHVQQKDEAKKVVESQPPKPKKPTRLLNFWK